MSYLTDDPTYVLAALGLAAVALLVALRVTQQGKYLLWAGVAAALALGIFGVERYWVTDAERVEAVVYDLADAIQASNTDRIKTHLDDNVTFGMKGHAADATLMLRLILPLLKQTQFDFVRVARLNTDVGEQSRRGSAEFTVTASGVFEEGGNHYPLGSLGTEWSLGFRESSPGVWKVNRITAMKLPRDVTRRLFNYRSL
ncbi:hypothetical protein P12x_000060 [Tundrisphaera lichenicola]|uniref:hypothetical protein n=1 Tax=Tundrisphaera lichenicola TaxID=2029860 RepID=UPI003EBA8AD7